MYRVTLPIHYDGYRYGIKFFRSVGETDDERIANIMKEKNFDVVKIEGDNNSQDNEDNPTILSKQTLERYASDGDTQALIEYAYIHEISLGNASKPDTILKKIMDSSLHSEDSLNDGADHDRQAEGQTEITPPVD